MGFSRLDIQYPAWPTSIVKIVHNHFLFENFDPLITWINSRLKKDSSDKVRSAMSNDLAESTCFASLFWSMITAADKLIRTPSIVCELKIVILIVAIFVVKLHKIRKHPLVGTERSIGSLVVIVPKIWSTAIFVSTMMFSNVTVIQLHQVTAFWKRISNYIMFPHKKSLVLVIYLWNIILYKDRV